MAEMIPERIPIGATLGEKRVFEVLEKLPDDYLVYYEPVISDRYPDFVVICPDLGLLVLEVKGWAAGSIQSADDRTVAVADGQHVKQHTHPIRQARDYQMRLMDLCRQDKAFAHLCHAEGNHQGQFLFPFCHLVVLTKIKSTQLREKGLIQAFPEKRVVPSDVFQSWETMDGARLKATLKAYFDPFWQFPRMNHGQVNVLRALIHPEIMIRKKPSPSSPRDTAAKQSHLSEVSIEVLDMLQERVARKIGHGHRIVNGVAGSGKTIILLHTARWLSKEDPKTKILVLCYNRALSEHLKNELADCKNVVATTFHQWAYSLKASGREVEVLGENLHKKLVSMSSTDKWDAVCIDEAQDFAKSWFQCAVQALKETEDGDLLLVVDGNQGLYRPADFRWVDVGVKAVGRVIPMTQNYRNTDQIMSFAWPFAEQTEIDDGEKIVPVRPVNAVRHGPLPLLRKAKNLNEEADTIVEIVKDLLKGQWDSKDIGAGLNPTEIGILYPRVPHHRWAQFFALKERLESLVPVVWLNDRKDREARTRVDQDGLKLMTIHTSKGLQYEAVILMWADLLPSGMRDSDENEERRRLYVGITRAKTYLAVTYSRDSKFTEQMEQSWVFQWP